MEDATPLRELDGTPQEVEEEGRRRVAAHITAAIDELNSSHDLIVNGILQRQLDAGADAPDMDDDRIGRLVFIEAALANVRNAALATA